MNRFLLTPLIVITLLIASCSELAPFVPDSTIECQIDDDCNLCKDNKKHFGECKNSKCITLTKSEDCANYVGIKEYGNSVEGVCVGKGAAAKCGLQPRKGSLCDSDEDCTTCSGTKMVHGTCSPGKTCVPGTTSTDCDNVISLDPQYGLEYKGTCSGTGKLATCVVSAGPENVKSCDTDADCTRCDGNILLSSRCLTEIRQCHISETSADCDASIKSQFGKEGRCTVEGRNALCVTKESEPKTQVSMEDPLNVSTCGAECVSICDPKINKYLLKRACKGNTCEVVEKIDCLAASGMPCNIECISILG